jgi:hypothetical protein
VRSCWTAALMIAEGPRKGEPSTRIMRYGLRTQPAPLVRGSSRRIMSLRFRPAYISVINRRASAEAVISSVVQKNQGERNLRFLSPLESPFFPTTGSSSKLTSRNMFPPSRPSKGWPMPERCSPSRVRFAAPNYGAPLTAPRRSGQPAIATGGSGGNMRRRCAQNKNQNPVPDSLTGSLHISSLTARFRAIHSLTLVARNAPRP